MQHGFSALTDRIMWLPSLSLDRKWPCLTKYLHLRVVCFDSWHPTYMTPPTKHTNRPRNRTYCTLCMSATSKLQTPVRDILQTRYHQNRVLVDDKDTQHAESNWLTVQTAQKHVYLHSTFTFYLLYKLQSTFEHWSIPRQNGNKISASINYTRLIIIICIIPSSINNNLCKKKLCRLQRLIWGRHQISQKMRSCAATSPKCNSAAK